MLKHSLKSFTLLSAILLLVHNASCDPSSSDSVVYSCTFEDGLCNFTITPSTSGFTWLRQSGSTPSQFTGPDFDHTTLTTSGHYVYAEASSYNPGETASLNFPPLALLNSTQSELCLTFYAHMDGQHIGTLNVTQFDTLSGRDMVLLNLNYNQSSEWLQYNVTLKSQGGLVQFKTVRGGQDVGQPYGDIAIDDVLVYDGMCGQVTTTVAPTTVQATTVKTTTTVQPTTTVQATTTVQQTTTVQPTTTRQQTTTGQATTTVQPTTTGQQSTAQGVTTTGSQSTSQSMPTGQTTNATTAGPQNTNATTAGAQNTDPTTASTPSTVAVTSLDVTTSPPSTTGSSSSTPLSQSSGSAGSSSTGAMGVNSTPQSQPQSGEEGPARIWGLTAEYFIIIICFLCAAILILILVVVVLACYLGITRRKYIVAKGNGYSSSTVDGISASQRSADGSKENLNHIAVHY